MNINTGLNPYNSNYVNGADMTKLSQSQSLTGSVADNLKEGEVFEGSVNYIDNGKVTIGLANGRTMTARLDAGVSLTPGQSVFFEVKSNDGNLIQIRPVSLTSLDANPTLLKALDMANLAATERTINMVNSMMQNSMSVSPENLTAMNRAMINNPGVDIQTLVTMSKSNLPITPENVSMFQNYANDKAVLSDNFDVISDMLHEIMTSSEVSTGDVIGINNAIRDIFVNVNDSIVSEATAEAENTSVVADSTTAAVSENATNVTNNPAAATENAAVIEAGQQPQVNGQAIAEQALNPNQVQSGIVETEAIISNQTESTTVNQAQVMENELGTQVLNTFASEKQIDSFNTILNTLPDFPKDNHEIFAENGTLKADADMNQVFREITDYLNNHPDIPKQTLNDIIGAPLYKGLLKNIITNSFAMEPKEVTKPGEISKLYERVLKQTEALERLVANFNNKAADTIKTQTSQIKQNVNFMNSANEMYNFIQIPLKMYNQNTDSMLYVRQNKKASYEQGEEITAFLHFDMEYLGSTDVFISLKESKVGCKWNLASEDSMKLIEDNLDILTERLAKKGFSVTSEVTCGEPKKNFVEDFLGAAPVSTENTAEGMVHRYSFDMRA
ncbi:flagellar hook-length control protein FliK [Pseudobutyrivibrio ruminis]|uniref:Hook-length control protein FliK n=1 Tax=Pseudobutyrivibrio ruminis DSM 9787 TaxID=1123011 RepID=A0A285R909_9FIRM|nr:flagellar hook-length control protein FliK [Pseudobutyrivibrio ruminis]SOB90580.1 hook-length control protein FliK [Pseudobutyrivibrio ruminis DSM 9787]